MVIEIDFLAWEKWQKGNLHPDEKVSDFMKNNPYYFAFHGAKFRAKDADLVALIIVSEDNKPLRFYELLAEDEKVAISKLVLIQLSPENTKDFEFAAYDVDAQSAEKLHQIFSALPQPRYGSREFRTDTQNRFYYHIHLASRYGDKIFDWAYDFENFLLADIERPKFAGIVKEITAICKAVIKK